jgi:bis(5'-nucleosidyl)-tetraphosphatase
LKDLFNNNFCIVHSAGGIVVKNNMHEIVLVNNKRNTWTFPKGHIESHESALTAAKREIFEETGLKNLEFIGDLGTYIRLKSSRKKSIQVFLFKTSQNELNPNDPDIQTAIWINKEKVLNTFSYKEDKHFFLKISYLI